MVTSAMCKGSGLHGQAMALIPLLLHTPTYPPTHPPPPRFATWASLLSWRGGTSRRARTRSPSSTSQVGCVVLCCAALCCVVLCCSSRCPLCVWLLHTQLGSWLHTLLDRPQSDLAINPSTLPGPTCNPSDPPTCPPITPTHHTLQASATSPWAICPCWRCCARPARGCLCPSRWAAASGSSPTQQAPTTARCRWPQSTSGGLWGEVGWSREVGLPLKGL